MFDVRCTGFFEHAAQRGLLRPGLRSFGAVLRRHVVFRHLKAGLLGQVMDRFNERHAGMFHQKADDIAGFAATKAVVELFGRAHAERGRLFAVKRTQPHEIGPAFFQLHMPPDDFHHVRAGNEFLNK